MKLTLVFDLDGTITMANTNSYMDVLPNEKVINQIREYHSEGAKIIIQTARNMRTFQGNIGEINIHTLPTILEWLDKHNVPYDEVLVGKPWCGHDGFYIDDRAVRPSEFVSMSSEDINEMLAKEKLCS